MPQGMFTRKKTQAFFRHELRVCRAGTTQEMLAKFLVSLITVIELGCNAVLFLSVCVYIHTRTTKSNFASPGVLASSPLCARAEVLARLWKRVGPVCPQSTRFWINPEVLGSM